MTEPRTVAGRAAVSAMRPHIRRALAQTISSIEGEATAPYVAALRDADAVLVRLVDVPGAPDALIADAGAVRTRIADLLVGK